MDAGAIAEVWSMLDRDALAAVARRGPPPVFATVSGAHLYGFASPDSDVDLRGAYLLPAADLLGLHPSSETLTIADATSIELDWVAHDLRKFARMMTQHNGYVLEQLYSPLVVIATPALGELRALGLGCVTRPLVRHYLGFAHGRMKRLREPEPTVKHLLYAYRVLLTGIHAMRTGEIVANLAVLNETARLAQVRALVQRKRAGAELMRLSERDLDEHLAVLEALEQQLHAAHASSALPEEPTTTEALGDLVVRVRLAAIAGGTSERSR